MTEIAEWLSPLDKIPTISWGWISYSPIKYSGCVSISLPSQIINLYFRSEELGITVENTEGHFELISITSIWKQICLRAL